MMNPTRVIVLLLLVAFGWLAMALHVWSAAYVFLAAMLVANKCWMGFWGFGKPAKEIEWRS